MLPAVRCNTWPATQAEQVNSFLKCAVTQLRASMYMDSRKVRISAALIQVYSGSGILLPMPTWAKLTSNHKAIGRFGGHVISVHMGTCTAGQHVLITGATAVGVHSA